MEKTKLPEGAFKAGNGHWCVKMKCERCGREYISDLRLASPYCKQCRRVFKKSKTRKTSASLQRTYRPHDRTLERRANNEYAFDERAALKQGTRRCHDCGKPSRGNYRCVECWTKLRRKSGCATVGAELDVDENFAAIW